MKFQDRYEAGEQLAQELRRTVRGNSLVLALPRGGVPVGKASARILGCALDVIPLMKIPIPWSPDASYGVVAVDGTRAINVELMERLDLSEREVDLAAAKALQEAKRRDRLYREGKPFPDVTDADAILVDDGLASGYSMLAAVRFVKARGPRSVIVASPVASDKAYCLLAAEPGIDRMVVLIRDAEPLLALSSYYREFLPLTDDDVLRALA